MKAPSNNPDRGISIEAVEMRPNVLMIRFGDYCRNCNIINPDAEAWRMFIEAIEKGLISIL